MNKAKQNNRIQLPEAAELTLNLVYIDDYDHTDTHQETLHTHTNAELIYVKDGKGRITLQHGEIDLAAGDFIIVNADMAHTEEQIDNEPFAFITLGFEGLSITIDLEAASIPQSLSEALQQRGIVHHRGGDGPSEIGTLLEHLLFEYRAKRPYYEAICQKLLELLIICLVRETDADFHVDNVKSTMTPVEYAKLYIDRHFAQNINLTELAEKAGIDKHSLVRKFRQEHGRTPIDYCIEKRLAAADSLMRISTHSLVDITNIVGFNSQAHFSQIYRKRRNMTPSQYRQYIRRDKV